MTLINSLSLVNTPPVPLKCMCIVLQLRIGLQQNVFLPVQKNNLKDENKNYGLHLSAKPCGGGWAHPGGVLTDLCLAIT